MIWLILGAVAIATEIKISDFSPLGQQLSWSMIDCIKAAVHEQETAFLDATTSYQQGYISAMTKKRLQYLLHGKKPIKKK